ncbi:glycine--tRNA ligase subunit beta [Litorimonas sp. RW-G-Af-16]|uniref:glycine--tRNA ligase subunit beta n=1 Tax=Litorimonas sp. RW-G-Af-16 TaxID=3241168 RepID=UPI003AAAAB7F
MSPHLREPRRLVFAADIPLRSPDVSEERKGPKVGSPEQALAGFMRAAGLTDISQAEIRNDPKKGEIYVAVMESAGRDSAEIIAELIPSVMQNFPWPKSMKSGRSNFRWVRPLRSMICLLDGKVVDFEVGGIKTGNTTEGHRRLGKGPFDINDLSGYVKALEGEGHVVLSHEKRKQLIIDQARKACSDQGLELVEDEGLLAEVAGLAEWPVVILGDMDPRFLELPSEVIRLSMRTHQKYFAVRDPKTGKLAPNFIVVANQAAPDGGQEIAKGNSKVLSARLSDAVFFQSEDRKKNLIEYYDKLDTVVFHKKLGSIKDKAERVAALARELAPKVGADPDKAEQAAKLAKCDLVTQTVIEFTSLQGQIGRLMYEAEEGADPDIAAAIEDHYKPQGPNDSVPTNPVAVAVALADKLDTLVGFWAIDEKPTGSKDPFALRRAALGVVRIILENGVRLKLFDVIVFARCQIPGELTSKFSVGAEKLVAQRELEKETNALFDQKIKDEAISELGEWHDEGQKLDFHLFAFVLDRMAIDLKDKGSDRDCMMAVISRKSGGNLKDDLVAIVNRVTALQTFLDTKDGEDLLAGYKRAANILKAEAKKCDLPDGAPKRPSAAESAALYDALQTAGPQIETALADRGLYRCDGTSR